jgi:putative membrane protein
MADAEASGTPAPSSHRDGFYVRGWILAVIGAVVVVGIAIAIGVAVHDHDDHRRPFGRFDDHGGAHPLRLVILLLLIALVVAGVVYLVRRLTERAVDAKAGDGKAGAATSAEAILAERFARGEIDEADYVSRRNALRS